MVKHEIDKLITEGLTARGTEALTSEELLECLDAFDLRGLFIQSIEAFEIEEHGVNHPMRVDLSILGLDGEENWEIHKDPKIMRQLVEKKVKFAIENGLKMEFLVWLDEMENNK